MRALLFFMTIVSILALSTGNSFAQTAGPSQKSVLGIYAQIKVQDSSGNLVAYIETLRVTVFNPEKLNSMINANMGMFDRHIANVGGKNIEILQVNDSVIHKSPNIISLNLISVNTPNGQETLAAADHDGYPVIPGDKVTTYWTIIRSAS